MIGLMELVIWTLLAAVVVILACYLIPDAFDKMYYTRCPSCGFPFRWHTKEQQTLLCKKCKNIFISRNVED